MKLISHLTGAPSCSATISKRRLAFSLVLPFMALCAAVMPASAQLTENPDYFNSFTANVGQQSTPQTITVTNTGTSSQTLSIGFYNIFGPPSTLPSPTPPQFSQTNTCGASLAPGASCTITVNFTPTIQQGTQTFLTLTSPTSPSLYLDGYAEALGNSDIVLDIDAPAANSTITGKFIASGWAIDKGNGINGVNYSIDQLPTFGSSSVVYGYSRSDVCQVYPGITPSRSPPPRPLVRS